MKVDKRYLSLAAVCLGLVVFVSIIMGLIARDRHRNDAAQSVVASADAMPPAPVATTQPTASDTDTPGGFGTAQDDREGYDGHSWGASVADVAGRHAKAQPTFTIDSAANSGALDLPTIIWMGIGLPANHQRAQADTFDPASFRAVQFSTLREGRTQYIFADGRFVMAVVDINANQYESIQQKLATSDQEVPSLRAEQTFDLSQAGSGLPPDTISTECFRKPNTNTRIYLVEKWSSSLLGTVTYHRVFEVYIPNSDYLALMNQATHPLQTAKP